MKNKKGFTLIELIAVIVILAIILVIGTLSIQRFITKGRNKSFDVLVNSFQDSAKTAYTECILKPKSDFCGTHPVPGYNESVTVTLGELIDAEFSDILKNPWKTSEECDRNSTVTLTRKEDSQIVFDYKTCLICGDHKTCEGENGGGENNNPEPGPITPIPDPTPPKKTLRELILEDNPTIYTNPILNDGLYSEYMPYPSGLYSLHVSGGFGGGNGNTYYFRGHVENNYVSFAGKTWRIVRINEDGTVRLILDTTISEEYGYAFIGDNDRNDIDMYYTKSDIKPKIEAWYNRNITGTNATKVATGNYFCEAARVRYHYDATMVNVELQPYYLYTPDLTCATDANGHGLVNAAIGFLTYDEVVYAGGYFIRYNDFYYLQNHTCWWTMSPAGKTYYMDQWGVWDNGGLYSIGIGNTGYYPRPVINLKANVTATKDENGVYVID